MQAIIPNRPARSRPYAWGSITVNPDPPRVGEVCQITFPLLNPGPDDVIVERIETQIALFGIGVRWESLPTIGPFTLPADERHIEPATIDWTPREGGHRCVRAAIHMRGASDVCRVGRNLQVIEADVDEDSWRVPFRLGNPAPEAAPIELRVGGGELAAMEARLRVRGELLPLGRPIWLQPGEEVAAELLLRARTDSELHHIRTVEATVKGRLLDGIQVTVLRPARVPDDDARLPISEAGVLASREMAPLYAR